MKPLKLLLLLCLMTCVDGWAQAIYYVTKEGAGNHSGESWQNALDETGFSDKFSSSPSGTTFRMGAGVFRPKNGLTGFTTDKAFILEGGYKSVEGTMTRDLSTMGDDDMTILLGDISTDPTLNSPISFNPDADGMETSGIIFESSAPADFFVLNSQNAGGEIVMKKGVGRRPQNKPCENGAMAFADTIIAGGKTNFGVEDLDIIRNEIGTFQAVQEKTGDDGCVTTYTYTICVLPKAKEIDGNLHYYVKVGAKGDGSSWDNAMGDTAFAYSINKVNDGATFHLAEGTYKPVYDRDGNPQAGNMAKSFFTTKLINLQGGYDKNATGEATPDPKNHLTILNGDILSDNVDGEFNNSDDVFKILTYEPTKSGKAHVDGLSFVNSRSDFSQTEFGNAQISMKGSEGGNQLEVTNCTFSKGQTYLRTKNSSCTINNCYFADSKQQAIHSGGGSLSINASTFKDNINVFNVAEQEKLEIINCTFTSDTSKVKSAIELPYEITELKLINNTITTPIKIGELTTKAIIVGNIFGSTMEMAAQDATISNNLYVNEEGSYEPAQPGNTKITKEDMTFLLDNGDNQFTVKDNGGFTPTIGLLSDTLQNGTSIRFDRIGLTDVDTDQRGNLRPESTCAGSIEKGFPTIDIILADTIALAGSEYVDNQLGLNTVYEIGTYELEKRLEHGSMNIHDTIYTRRVTILPNGTKDADGKFHYYVKVGAKGDGSSWGNAMGDTAFAFSLNKVDNGATFHLAEGVYHPVYDKDGEPTTTNIIKMFYTNKAINLQGGYPASVSENIAAQPDKFLAVLSGDLGNNTYAIDSAGKGKGDVTNVLYYDLQEAGDVHLSGLALKGYINPFEVLTQPIDASKKVNEAALIGIKTEGEAMATLTMEDCQLVNSNDGLVAKNCNVNMENCYFYDNFMGSSVSGGNLSITKSTFEESFLKVSTKNCQVKNSTYISKTVYGMFGLLIDASESILVENNTFLTGFEAQGSNELIVTGNIFADTTSGGGGKNLSVSSTHNIYNNAIASELRSSEDINVSPEDFYTILSSEVKTVDGKIGFVHETYRNGIPVIPMKNDSLGEVSLRFPLEKVSMKEDQRGNPRPELTSAGSVEKGFPTINIILADTTVLAGDKYIDSKLGLDTIYAIGAHDELKKLEHGSMTIHDTTYTRHIIVLPRGVKGEDGNLHYYVKVEGQGDGSSWNNAMGNKEFAFSINKVNDGSTFHIADGTYRPIYDKDGNNTTNNDDKVFYTTKLVNLEGGYDKGETNINAKADPKNNLTIFDGDILGDNTGEDVNVVDDVLNVIIYNAANPGKIHVNGLTFKNGWLRMMGSEFYNAQLAIYSQVEGFEYEVSECSFSGGQCFMGIGNCSGKIRDCFFDYPRQRAIISIVDSKSIDITSCTFQRTAFNMNGYETFNITNCTFKNPQDDPNNAMCQQLSAKELRLINNTIMMNVNINESVDKTEAIGNIFGLNVSILSANTVTSNNIYLDTAGTYSFSSPTDRKVTKEDLMYILDNDGDQYISKENGGFTPSINLISDMLKDGTSIRFNRIGLTDVETDQRGNLRPESTCAGSIEKGFPSINIVLADTTVHAGDAYADNKLGINTTYSIGAYDVERRLEHGSLAIHDTIYTRHITVLPNARVIDGKLHYYVKVGGNGDGSSWDNAMGDTAFAFSINKVTDGATFHIAEGVYHPIYDKAGVLTNVDKDRMYYTTKAINLQGGYPAGVSGDVEAKPDQYIAALSGDLAQTTYAIDSVTKGGRDVTNVLYYDLTNGGNIRLSGLALKGSFYRLSPDATSQVGEHSLVGVRTQDGTTANLTMEDCQLVNSSYALYAHGNNVNVKNCYFFDNTQGSIVIGDKLTFTNNTVEASFISANAEQSNISNCTFISKTAGSSYGLVINNLGKPGKSALLENNTFLTGVGGDTCINVVMTGNIFASPTVKFERVATITSAHNIYRSTAPASELMSENDITLINLVDLNKLIGKVTDGENGVTTEKIRETYRNGIPVIPINEDKIGDISIRFPSEKVTMKEDQRGAKRLDSTCVGAYELGCQPDTIYEFKVYKNSEIAEGTVGMNNKKDEVTDAQGCIQVYITTYVKLPSEGRTEYYVKTTSTGKGDGSSWDDAMSNEAFQLTLRYMEGQKTYHIASGNYEPIYDALGQKPLDGKDRTFYTGHAVTIIGGYPENAAEGDASDPKANNTTFTSGKGEQSALNLFTAMLSDKGSVRISGVVFSGRKDGEAVSVAGLVPGVSLSMQQCKVENFKTGVKLDSVSATISECSFKDSVGILTTGLHADSLSIESSTFTQGGQGVVCTNPTSKLIFKNSTFVGLDKSAIDYSACTSASCELVNNTILDNVYTASATNDKWTGNIIGGKIIRKGTGGEKVASSYNLYLNDEEGVNKKAMETNSSAGTDIWTNVLCEEVLACDGGSYQLSNNKGFTETVALTTDMIEQADSTVSLRFPKVLDKDQRGVERMANSCMGAYEFIPKPIPMDLDIPTAFTPYTEDKRNDIFMKGYEVYVYNRYGMLICHSTDGWDGKYNNKMATPGVYAYVLIIPENGEQIKGTIEILKAK